MPETQKKTHTHANAGYGDVARICISKCIPAPRLHKHTSAHARSGFVLRRRGRFYPKVCVCVCVCQAVVEWAQFDVLARVPSLHKNATQLLRRGIRSSWRHFSLLLPFLSSSFFRPLQSPLHKSSPLFLAPCAHLCSSWFASFAVRLALRSLTFPRASFEELAGFP